MCTVSLLAWVMTVIKELKQVATLTRAIHNVPCLTTTTIATDGDAIEITGLSKARVGWFYAACMMRVMIVVWLLVFGIEYIGYTIGLQDLLLNAVALEFVIDIDDMLYEVLSPRRVKRLMSRIRGLPIESPVVCQGIDLVAFGCAMSLGVVLVSCYALLQAPFKNLLLEAKDALCGGEIHFVYTVDGLGAPFWASTDGLHQGSTERPVRPWHPSGEDESRQLNYAGVRRVLVGPPAKRHSFCVEVDLRWRVNGVQCLTAV